jgi:uncharacterized membrane protein
MKRMFGIFSVIFASLIAQSLYYYPLLPETVAQHFDSQGKPNGWASREVFFAIYLGVTFLVMGMFLVIGCVLQKSPQYMNIPNKDHWLSPENRDETIRTITGGMALIGGLAGLLSLVVGQYAIQKNLTPGPIAMDAYIIWLVLGFVGITLVWSISVTVKYMRPPPKHL